MNEIDTVWIMDFIEWIMDNGLNGLQKTFILTCYVVRISEEGPFVVELMI
jgi:hypothetical protein